MTEKQKLFLTLNIGKKAEESEIQEFKRYVGITPVTVLAVNPTKKELEELYPGITFEEPEYVSKDADGKQRFQLVFHVKTDPEWGNKIDATSRIRFFLTDQVNTSRDGEKCQVIDKYGETCWVTREQYKAQMRPDTSRVVGEYRPAHRGEAELYEFLKCWLNIEDAFRYNKETKRWDAKSEEERKSAEIQLDWAELCKGNISAIKNVVKDVKDYKLKTCWGIRTTEDNRHYQDVCNKVFLKNSSNYYIKFDNVIQNLKQRGSYADTTFSSDNLKEWKPQQTEFTNTITAVPTSDADIFGNDVKDLPNDLPF